MTSLTERAKSFFRRDTPSYQMPPGTIIGGPRAPNPSTTIIRKPIPEEDNNNSYSGSSGNYNVQKETQAREQQHPALRNESSFENIPRFPSSITSTSNAPPRAPTVSFMPGTGRNNAANPTDIPPVSTTQPSVSLPPQNQNTNARPSDNLTPKVTNNAVTSIFGSPPDKNQNPSTSNPSNNPSIAAIGSPPDKKPTQFQPSANTAQNASSNQPSEPPSTVTKQTVNPLGLLFGKNLPATSSPQTSTAKNNPNNSMMSSQGSTMKSLPSFPNQSSMNDDNVSRIELDYPIENVLIDANIPPKMAIKLNEAVEQDRLGNAYHVHRYTFEPPLQNICIGNEQCIARRLNNNTCACRGGTRHIREIRNPYRNGVIDDVSHRRRSKPYRRSSYAQSDTSLDQYFDQLLRSPNSMVIQVQNLDHLQQILSGQASFGQMVPTQPWINSSYLFSSGSFTQPLSHFVANALPNDPMRNY